jgi:hypothetical protein
MHAPKVITRNLLVLVTFLFVARLGYAQAIGPTVETPTSRRGPAVVDSSDSITMAGEFKSTKNVQMEEKKPCWDWYADFGYESEYNFRGTNLTPDADGAIFMDADISRWGFTLGMFAVRQLGIAKANSFSIGEGGGGGSGASLPGGGGGIISFSPETVQKDFGEIDIFLQYHHEIGPIDVTVGNIGFLIDRDAQTFLNTVPFGLFGPFATVQNEQFDRFFIRLATSVIPHIQPWITYYQTVYNDGEDHDFYQAPHIPPNGITVFYGDPTSDRFHERNDRLGGYLEGRLRGNFALCDWAEFNPYGVISFSFHDRTEPVPDATKFTDIIRGRSLTGFNVAQAGFELPIRLLFIRGYSSGPCPPPSGRLNFVPFGTYSYHISEPTASTDRDEVFGGAKFALTF